MRSHLRRRATQRSSATPILPSGNRGRQPSCFVPAPPRWPSIACVATPRIWTDGACNAIRTLTRTGS